MSLGESLYRDLIDEARGLRRQRRGSRLRAAHDRFGHEPSRIDLQRTRCRESGVLSEGSVELHGVRIDQKFRRIEPVAASRIEGAVGAQAITRAGLHARDKAMMDFVIGSPWQGQAREFAIAAL